MRLSSLSLTQIQEDPQKELANGLASDFACDNNQPALSKDPILLDASFSLSSSIASPSTLVSESPLTPVSQSNIPFMGNNDSYRLRSQMFSFNTIDPSLISTDESLDKFPSNPSYQQSMSAAGLKLLFEESNSCKISLNTSSCVLKRNNSDPSMMNTQLMNSFLFPHSNTLPISPPESPTQDEAQRALELLMDYFQHQLLGLRDSRLCNH